MKADSLFKDDCHSSLNCLPSIIMEFYYCRETKAKDKLNSLKQKENKGRKTSEQQRVALMTREHGFPCKQQLERGSENKVSMLSRLGGVSVLQQGSNPVVASLGFVGSRTKSPSVSHQGLWRQCPGSHTHPKTCLDVEGNSGKVTQINFGVLNFFAIFLSLLRIVSISSCC